MIRLLLFMPSLLLISQPLHRYGFENYPDEHEFVQANWTTQGFSVPWVNGFNNQRCHVDDAYSAEGSKSLRVRFDANTFGPSNNGAQAPLIVANHTELYAGYWVRFSNNFSWGTTSEGGKLPGLSGGNRCSGCATCIGTNGFTTRLMWRNGGRAVLYLYHMDKTGACGDNLQLRNPDNSNLVFQRGVWYHIAQRVKVNTVGQSNGEVETFVNGISAHLITGLRFVTNTDRVNALYFSTFHGGSDAAWAPTVTCHAWFDDIVISANRSDVLGPLSLQSAGSSLDVGNPSKTNLCFIDNGTLFIDVQEVANVQVFSSEAKLVRQSDIGQIDITTLPIGIYVVKFETSNGVQTQKILIR